VAATHAGAAEATKEITEYVAFGASPRAAIAIAEAARAMALFDGRPAAGFDDVKRVADAVLNHRVLTNYRARLDGVTSSKIVAGLVASLEETGVRLPDDVEVSAR
jgi:MoxR-like ATPase